MNSLERGDKRAAGIIEARLPVGRFGVGQNRLIHLSATPRGDRQLMKDSGALTRQADIGVLAGERQAVLEISLVRNSLRESRFARGTDNGPGLHQRRPGHRQGHQRRRRHRSEQGS